MGKCLVIACPHLYLVLCTLPRNLFHPCTNLVLSFAFMVLFVCSIIDVCGMVVSTRFRKLLKLGARLAPSGPVWTMYLAGWGLWWPEAYFPGITFVIILRGWSLNSPVWELYSEQHFPASENQKIIPSQRRYGALLGALPSTMLCRLWNDIEGQILQSHLSLIFLDWVPARWPHRSRSEGSPGRGLEMFWVSGGGVVGSKAQIPGPSFLNVPVWKVG